MGTKTVNNCVECGIGCIHCGREEEEVVFCDNCGDSDCTCYDVDGKDICEDCLENVVAEELICCKCGDPNDLVDYDGSIICKDCLIFELTDTPKCKECGCEEDLVYCEDFDEVLCRGCLKTKYSEV